jgi:hypothetical protein
MACGSGLTRGMVSFTHRALEALRPSYTPYRVSDQRCVGLAVRVAPSGVKTWDLAYRIRGSGKVRRKGTRAGKRADQRVPRWARPDRRRIRQPSRCGVAAHDREADCTVCPQARRRTLTHRSRYRASPEQGTRAYPGSACRRYSTARYSGTVRRGCRPGDRA